jgi:hypothetical protein
MQVVAESMRHPGWDFVHKDKVPTSPGVFTEPRKAAFLESIQIGDRLMARHDPLIAHEEFAAYIGSLTNARGVRLARSMSGFVRARTDSTMETWLRLVVWDAGFPDPMVNYPVTAAGQSRFLDLAWPELRIDLEFHGRQHFYEWEQAYGDVQRRGQLQMEGWVTVEATEEQLISPGKLLHRLGAVFASQRSARWRG